ncbi:MULTISPECIES: flagellar hook-associated protein FlgK [Brevibacillus]|uniref:flagellar hook-associated protein FlgK n=1 Tax=Brevibacillus TaxID=55080 RepID=UPI000271C3C8|nr:MULTISPECIES: flagellar hook-associated protein FlgK [Brevibacillus]EJL46898.1 flagellar hook-associated protein FlgK [Brevibacillus sp. CF112]MED1822646.1 flagellar hook-associated protein FlgK [Brevibacillus agri]
MRSTFHGIEVSKRGLFAQQSALNTTGHNIANANTEGYTRQRVNMQATTGLPYVGMSASIEPGILGTGVEVVSMQRLREDYLDQQYRNETKHNGYWEARQDGLSKIETIMNEPSDTGLQAVMDQLWQSWQDLAKEPESLSARAVVRQRAIALTETFSALSTSMTELQADLDNVVSTKVLDINSMAKQLANLNKQISDLVPHGYQPNDLYDQRDLLLDKLSKLVEVKVTNGTNGMVNVTVDGQALVTGRETVEMQTVKNPVTGLNDITLGGAPFVPKSGGLLGTMESRGMNTVDAAGNTTVQGVIPQMMEKLNALATNIATEVNELHRKGLNLFDIANKKSNPGAPSQDIPFFVDSDELAKDPNTKAYPKDLSKMVVNPAILASLNAIAAAKPDASGTSSEGDNTNALDIAAIKYKMLSLTTGTSGQPETTTLDDFYRYTIAQLGVDSQEAQRMELNSEILVGQVDTQRQSVSGVSLDEEMAEMVKYQHAFSASARVMTSMDEILDKIINGMGRVGL